MKTIYKRISTFVSKYYFKFENWLSKYQPDTFHLKGSVWLLWIVVALLFGWAGTKMLRLGYGVILDFIVGIAVFILVCFLVFLVVRIVLYLIKKLPAKYTGKLLGLFLALTLILEFTGGLPLLLLFILGLSLLGGTTYRLIKSKNNPLSKWAKIRNVSLFLISLGGLIAGLVWVLDRGDQDDLMTLNLETEYLSKTLDAPDPSIKGDYNTISFSYGSGKDRRDQFGSSADFITPQVDATELLKKPSGTFKKWREKYWGFGRDSLALNGTIWMPDGDGAFPLVLIVHGNHFMRDYSDPGYQYLGEFLSSKGYILVSIDENFLNGDWTSGSRGENDARGWVLLKHLEQWKEWQTDSSHPMYQKADMDRISLIGHSRGGEAVSVAAAFNKLPCYPDDADLKFDFNFNIKSIIAIAQVDGQYLPSDQSTPIEDVSYLALHGSHDADVADFAGDKQYKRVMFTEPGHLKSSIYIYRANHGQFNTGWGDTDWGRLSAFLLNREALIDGEDQRKIAKIYISSFLDITLKNDSTYLPLLKDYRRAAQWLPETYFINRFQNSKDKILIDFEEDINLHTSKIPQINIETHHLSTWREEDLGFRAGSRKRQNKAVYLGWNHEYYADTTYKESQKLHPDSIPYFQFNISIDSLFDPSNDLLLSLAQIDEKPKKPREKDKNIKKNEKEEEKNNENNNNANKDEDESKDKNKSSEDSVDVLNFSLSFQDSNAEKVAIEIQNIHPILPPFKARYTRFAPLEEDMGDSSEAILQSIRMPFSKLEEINSNFNIHQIRSITFLFDSSAKGVIVLDEIGIGQ